MMIAVAEHIPVLADKTLQFLKPKPGGVYVDGTVGLGGHSERILTAMKGRGRLIALDRDEQALSLTRDRLSDNLGVLELHHENFKNLPLILSNLGITGLDGCLIDLGVSSLQFDDPDRGFSFRSAGPLDMRMDTDQRLTAEDLIHRLSAEELTDLFRRFGEEPQAKKIAGVIVESRSQRPLRSTCELADLIARAKRPRKKSRIHPATQVFQALRIAVNQELDGLDTFITETVKLLKTGARLVVISFHSLEDRIVKKTFQLEAGRCICFKPGELCTCPRIPNIEILTRKPVTPAESETDSNPRARSAKLRAAERSTHLAANLVTERHHG
jgi:16S rRNA (cytosine1402-N4)-methyltransferase